MSQLSKLKPWADHTREERFFTSVLHHELINECMPFSELLCREKLGLNNVRIDDFGFEVCFFRDFFFRGTSINRFVVNAGVDKRSLMKTTFDFMFFLSDGTAVILEAKAQQGFKNKQINKLKDTIALLRDDMKIFTEVYLVGLVSSRYMPAKATRNNFKEIITWKDISRKYSGSQNIFDKADIIYGK